jgi:DNA-binding NtrC family response regulator
MAINAIAQRAQTAVLGPPPLGLGEYSDCLQVCETPAALLALCRRGRVDVALIAETAWADAERELATIDGTIGVLRFQQGGLFSPCLLDQAASLRAQFRATAADGWQLNSGVPTPALHGDGEAMAGLRARLRQVADAKGPLTIAGAPGTPLLASAALLHSWSSNGPLLHLDLRKKGHRYHLEHASGGTSVLDLASGGMVVLSHLDAATASVVHLLEGLAHGVWTPPGENTARTLQCRLVGTLERDPALPGTVSTAAGLPSGFTSRVVRVPSLCERKTDLAALIARRLPQGGQGDLDLGVDADYDWPGNDRELDLRCALAVVTTGAPLTSSALICDGECTLAHLERQAIVATLRSQGGHRRRTADALGIGLRTLGVKLSQWRAARLLPPGV